MPFFRREKRPPEEENLELLYPTPSNVEAAEQPANPIRPAAVLGAGPAKPRAIPSLPPVAAPGPKTGDATQGETTPPVTPPAPIAHKEELLKRREQTMNNVREEELPYPHLVGQPSAPRSSAPEQAARTSPTTAETIVDHKSHFSGTFRSEADLRIEGTFEGEIDCSGTVTVAEDATLSATVHARHLVIAGSARGDITCDERLSLLATGELRGKAQAATLAVEEGAFFEGEFKMSGAQSPSPESGGWESARNGRAWETVADAEEQKVFAGNDPWEEPEPTP